MSEVLEESTNENVGLADLPRLLKSITGERVAYQSLYRAILDGDIPAGKAINGRWFVRRSDIPEIIEAFDLKRKWHK